MSLKDAYVEIKWHLDAAQREVNSLESKVLEQRRRVTHLGGMLVTLRDSVCQKCLGRGEYWVSYGQDETKMESCDVCGGSGLPKP